MLLDADLTPYDGVGSKGRADREAEDETENNSRLTGKAAAAAPKVRSSSNTKIDLYSLLVV